jgi:putative ABC transport system permease protein
MKVWLRLALLSAWSRRLAVGLVVASLGLACALVLTVQQLRSDARQSFSQAVSGVDLIVGPRGSATEILLYSVFQLGRPTANMPAKVLPEIQTLAMVDWALPLQLGDSYQGFPVWGTEATFFQRFQVHGRALKFREGKAFEPRVLYQVVLGAEVARQLKHRIGDRLVVTHGSGQALDKSHDDSPFTLVGILEATGGSVDRAVLVSVASYEALHHGWGVGEFQGLRLGAFKPGGSKLTLDTLNPREYTAILVGLTSRAQVFSARRAIEQLPGAPLTAVLPGVALDDLWRSLSLVEDTLLVIGFAVAVTGMLSVVAVMLVALGARRRELAILRALGASPARVLWLLYLEAVVLGFFGLLLGYVVQQAALFFTSGWLRESFGLSVEIGLPSLQSLIMLAGLFFGVLVAAFIPAFRAYRLSLADGLNPAQVH